MKPIGVIRGFYGMVHAADIQNLFTSNKPAQIFDSALDYLHLRYPSMIISP
jgi:hypothetical protein